ncbi:MAG: hypothetical protein K2G87_09995, partial [Oscillospiraceae bacterium]|nr:hypothetical protein [Oscillospiraceae bacterium]
MKTVHRTVFKGYFVVYRYKEGRSCSPLLETLSRFSPPAPFRNEREFRALRSATKGLCPLDFCELGSARPA